MASSRPTSQNAPGQQERPAAALMTPSDLSSEATGEIAQSVNRLVADAFALYVKTKNFHWHISGPSFRDYHLLLDEQGAQIYASIDPLAERVRKLGQTTLRSIDHIARLARVKGNDADFVSPIEMLSELLEDNKAFAKAMRVCACAVRRQGRPRHRRAARDADRRNRETRVVPLRGRADGGPHGALIIARAARNGGRPMLLSQQIAAHIPYLRRYARALTGSQESGDAYVLTLLEAIVEDSSILPRDRDSRVPCIRCFRGCGRRWRSIARRCRRTGCPKNRIFRNSPNRPAHAAVPPGRAPAVCRGLHPAGGVHDHEYRRDRPRGADRGGDAGIRAGRTGAGADHRGRGADFGGSVLYRQGSRTCGDSASPAPATRRWRSARSTGPG